MKRLKLFGVQPILLTLVILSGFMIIQKKFILSNWSIYRGKGNTYDFGIRMYDLRICRWLKPDALESKYPSTSPYAFTANNPIFMMEIDGNDFIATTAMTKRQVKAALKTVFGANSGFSFKGNKLVYKGNGRNSDAEKEYVLNVFLDEVVNNAHNHVYIKEEGSAENGKNIESGLKVPKEQVREGGDITVTYQRKTSTGTYDEGTVVTEYYSTIFLTDLGSTFVKEHVDGNDGEASPLNYDQTRIFWHAIGHVLTNQRLEQTYGRLDANTPTAQKQTIGFDNLVAKFLGVPENKGRQHGNSDKATRGEDTYYKDAASAYGNLKTAFKERPQ
jgi:RHS repeat-associated protein